MKRRDFIAGGLALGVAGALNTRLAQAAEAVEAGEAPKPALVLGGHIGPISQVAYSPDGGWLVSSAVQFDAEHVYIGGETRLWDARTGKLERVLLPDIEGQKMQWSSDGRTLALPGMRWHDGGGSVSTQLWDTSSPDASKWTARHTLDEANAASVSALSPDGKYFLAGLQNRESSGAMAWDVASGEPSARLSEQSGFLTSAAFAPDGQSLFTASWKGALGKFEGTSLQWWSTAGAPEKWELSRVEIVPQRLSHATISRDGSRLAYVREKDDISSTLVIADARSGKPQHEITSAGWFLSPQWSPDGKSLAVSQVTDARDREKRRGQVQLFDTQNWNITASLGAGKRMISALAWSPDGKSLALGSGDKAVEIYRL